MARPLDELRISNIEDFDTHAVYKAVMELRRAREKGWTIEHDSLHGIEHVAELIQRRLEKILNPRSDTDQSEVMRQIAGLSLAGLILLEKEASQ